MKKELAVEMHGISLVYPNGVVANKDVDFSCYKGEIHALMGENGAGKSTLMKVLFGMEEASRGEIWIRGEKVRITSPAQAIKLGIGMVHQHFMLVESLSVTENVILGMEPKKNALLDYKKAREMVRATAEKYRFAIDPDAKIHELGVGKKQKVEIIKALIRGAKILIMDEPTAVLTPQETEELFEQLEILKSEGHTIIFISHKLKEIKRICDRMTIMRAGRVMGVHEVDKLSTEDISRLMIGRDIVQHFEKKEIPKGELILSIRNLTLVKEGKNALDDIDLDVYGGRILGIAGIEGNGQREFADCISGLQKANAGSVKLCGKEILGESIKKIRKLGLSHIPEDRMRLGVAADESISDNLISERYDQKAFNRGFLQNRKAIQKLSRGLIEEYQIVADSEEAPVAMLSGGNIQKVVAAREMSLDFDLLLADQPTRGIDVGAAAFIHERLLQLRAQGKAILLISADLNEVLELSDSLAVFYEGKIAAYFESAKELTEEELGLYMLGIKQMEGGKTA